MTRKEYIEQMQRQDPDEHIAVHEWCADDVLMRADDIGESITKQDANDIIDGVNNDIDSEFGLTWNTLDAWIRETVDNKK